MGARSQLTFAPRKSRSGDGLAPYSQESKLKALARLPRSLSFRAAMGNASRTELCCLMGRLSGGSPVAPLFEVWPRLRASQAPSGAQIAALQRTKSPVETKFDLQRLSCQVWVLSMAKESRVKNFVPYSASVRRISFSYLKISLFSDAKSPLCSSLLSRPSAALRLGCLFRILLRSVVLPRCCFHLLLALVLLFHFCCPCILALLLLLWLPWSFACCSCLALAPVLMFCCSCCSVVRSFLLRFCSCCLRFCFLSAACFVHLPLVFNALIFVFCSCCCGCYLLLVLFCPKSSACVLLLCVFCCCSAASFRSSNLALLLLLAFSCPSASALAPVVLWSSAAMLLLMLLLVLCFCSFVLGALCFAAPGALLLVLCCCFSALASPFLLSRS